jgi:hypothetical protein
VGHGLVAFPVEATRQGAAAGRLGSCAVGDFACILRDGHVRFGRDVNQDVVSLDSRQELAIEEAPVQGH